MSLKDLLGRAKDRLGDRGSPADSPGPLRDTESNGNGFDRAGILTAPPAPARRRDLLVVAREPRTANKLVQMAERLGHACTVRTVLSEVKPTLAGKTFHAAVLLDDLPRESVLLLGAVLRTAQASCRVVVVTPETCTDYRERLSRIGVEDVLQAPVLEDTILETATAQQAAAPDLTRFGDVSEREIASLRALLELQPESRENLWLLGFACYRSKRFTEALEVLERITRRNASDTQALYYIGSCNFRLGRFPEAQEAWRMVTVLAPATPIAQRAQKHLGELRRSQR